jgi:hypothetical protein
MPTTTTVNGGPPDLDRETGSAVDAGDRLFLSFEDGAIFTPHDFEVRKVEEMLRADGRARSLEAVLTLPMRGAAWSIEPGEGDSGQADWAREMLTREANAGGMSTPLDLVLAQLTGAVLFRRSYFEKVFTVLDGNIVYDKLAFRPPASCRVKFDKQTGAFEGFEQYVGSDHKGSDERGYVHIKPDRALVYIHGQHRSPLTGTSDLETAYNVWVTKQKIRFLWAAFLENQTMPKAVANSGSNDPGETQRFAEKVATLKGGGVVGIGSDQSVEPFESSGSGAAQYQAAMAYLDAEMAQSVLAGFLGLSDSSTSAVGSYALSKDATDFFVKSRQAVLTEMATVFTNFGLADLIRWNFGTSAPVPHFKFGPIIPEQADQALELFKGLATGAGINPAVPREFVDILTAKVAKLLGMDEGKVAEAIRKNRDPNATPTDELRTGVENARTLVQQAGLGEKVAA